MNFFNNYSLGNRKGTKDKRNLIKIAVCFSLISIFFLSSVLVHNQNNQFDFSNKEIIYKDKPHEELPYIPKISDDPSELQDPFTINFTNIWNYFKTNFKSDLTDYDIPTYINETGVVVDEGVNSLDNLLLYNTLLDVDYDQTETLEAYINLKSTPLWYENNSNNFEYGFVGTIDGTTGEVTESNRYLIDNVMPIYLLLEDANTNLVNIEYDVYSANEEFEKAFFLINSSVFYDDTDKAFLNSNTTTTANIYQMKSNFYAVLAYYLIHQQRDYINTTIGPSAYNIASDTTEMLVSKMWDTANLGFFKSAPESWTFPGSDPREKWKYLDVNALGILALLEYYEENEGMYDTLQYLENATILYNLLDNELYDIGGVKAYRNFRTEAWGLTGFFEEDDINLEANSIMLRACLRLFELTGDITYYERAFDLYQYLERNLYNSNINAYETSRGGAGDNSNINFHANLRLIESYLEAFEIYNSTFLDANFNVSDNRFIFNQGVINITCDYKFEKTISYSHPAPGGFNTTTYNNITDGVIAYTFRYPNNTIISEFRFNITDNYADHYYNYQENTTTFIYPITDALPIDNGYTITIKVNSTYFGVAFANLTFDIKSGLSLIEIIGKEKMEKVDDFYQGQTENITLLIWSDYNYNLTLNVTLEGFGIDNYTQYDLNFVNNTQTQVEFNISALFDATSGVRTLFITFKNGTILYLEVPIEDIIISNALTYSNLMYSGDVVPGNSIQVSLDLKNYLPDNKTSLNLTFTGEFVSGLPIFPFTLDESEAKSIEVSILVSGYIDVDSIEITLRILKGNTVIKSEILTVNILSKFEIISIKYPEKVIQGVPAKLILIIENNQDSSEEFTLEINDNKVDTDLEELIPGENRIEVEVLPTINPYEFGYKKFEIQIEDEGGDVIVKDYFESEIQLSTINLLLFYVLPMAIPIGLILYYKNKEIKIKLLRR